jgi:hypothetical protein
MAASTALHANCHCGAVRIRIAQAPDYLNECNCSLCHSHGVWWGYFAPDDVGVTGITRVYTRADREAPSVELHFCKQCGCTTHWAPLPAFLEKVGENKCGVNMRLFDRAALAGIELRFPDGANWNGIGQWGFARDAEILD